MSERHIILDTETTGLDVKQGHRVIELAAVEVVGRQVTGRHFHRYLDPDRDIDAGATEVHGMTWESLKGKPRFHDVVDEFLDFLAGGQLVIHNAPFDVSFLDAELVRLEREPICSHCSGIVDTLKLAREQFPGKRNNLDALCERFEVAHSHRTLHGALLDARLLAEVYLSMTRGQESLDIPIAAAPVLARTAGTLLRRATRVLRASADEVAAHQSYLESLDRESRGRCLWLRVAQAAISVSRAGEPEPAPVA